jgi:hypothetical protein
VDIPAADISEVMNDVSALLDYTHGGSMAINRAKWDMTTGLFTNCYAAARRFSYWLSTQCTVLHHKKPNDVLTAISQKIFR